VAKRPPVPPIANDVDAAGALKPNALLAVEAAGWPNSDGVEPNAEPNPTVAVPVVGVPNPVIPVAPNAGAVEVTEVLPKPPNPVQALNIIHLSQQYRGLL